MLWSHGVVGVWGSSSMFMSFSCGGDWRSVCGVAGSSSPESIVQEAGIGVSGALWSQIETSKNRHFNRLSYARRMSKCARFSWEKLSFASVGKHAASFLRCISRGSLKRQNRIQELLTKMWRNRNYVFRVGGGKKIKKRCASFTSSESDLIQKCRRTLIRLLIRISLRITIADCRTK